VVGSLGSLGQAAEGLLPKFQAWRQLAVQGRTQRFADRGFQRSEDEAVDCILTGVPSSIVLTLPRSLLLAARGVRVPTEEEDEEPHMLDGVQAAQQPLSAEQVAAAVSASKPGLFQRMAKRRPKMATPGVLDEGVPVEESSTSSGEPEPLPLVPTLREQLESLASELHEQRAAQETLSVVMKVADEAARRDDLFDEEASDSGQGGSGSWEPFGQAIAERVWTTLLVLSVLQRQDESMLFSAEEDPVERTIVDGGREWLQAQARSHPLLAELLQPDALPAAADKVTARWQAVLNNRVAELRGTETINSGMSLSHIQRVSAELSRSVMTKHDTFSTFLKPAMDGLQRWQLFMILITLVMSSLLVNIWMYYSRGATCCEEVQLLLACDPAPAPCRGFKGDCGDIASQFQEMLFVDPWAEPQCVPANPVRDWVCHAFPDEENPIDTIIVGFIAIAVALPGALFLQSAFELSNEVPTPDTWLLWDGSYAKMLIGREKHKNWHYTDGQPPSRFVRWYIRFHCMGENSMMTVINLFRRLFAFLTCRKVAWEQEEGDDASEVDSAAERAQAASEARAQGIKKRMLASAGLIMLYITWLIFAWFTFTYGLLIYNTLGAKAQDEFSKSWCERSWGEPQHRH